MAFILPTSTLAKDYAHVCANDPALDDAAEDFDEKLRIYIETGDPSMLPVKPGQEPTEWTLRHLSEIERRKLLEVVKREGGQVGQASLYMACQMGLKGSDIRDAGGKRVHVEHVRDDDGHFYVSHAFMDVLAKAGVIDSIGLRVIKEAFPAKKS